MKTYCKKCGKEIPEGLPFCPDCGEKVSPADSAQTANPEKKAGTDEDAKLKKTIKIVAITLGSIMVIASIIIGILISVKPTVDLNRYTTVAIEGEDGYAKYVVVFDFDKLEKDFGGKVDIPASDEFWFGDFSQALIYQYVDYSVEVTGTNFFLTNGDTVTLIWDCDDEGAESAYDIKLKHKDIVVKVSGLD